MALSVVLVLVGLLAFDALFAWIHSIFFAEGSWQFSYDALLIRALPEAFWMGCAATWAVSLVILCAISTTTGLLTKKLLKRTPE